MRRKSLLNTRDSRGFAWTVVDQVFSSLSNVLISLAVARSSGAAGLGLYTAAFAAYLLALGFQRSLIGEPMLALGTRSGRSNAGEALTVSLALGSVAGAVAVLGGFITSSRIFMIVGPVLVVVLGQDLIRYELFRIGQPRTATILDALWVVVSAAGFAMIVSTGSPELATVIWGIGGAAGLLVGILAARIRLVRWAAARTWWLSEARRLATYLTAENLVYVVADGVATVGIAATLGATGLGELKAAEIVLSPGFLALNALNLFLVPRLTQLQTTRARHAVGPSAVAAGTGLLMMLTVVLIAPLLAGFLYSEQVAVPRDLLVPLALRIVVAAGSVGALAMLKADGRGRAIVAARVAWAVLGLPIVLLALRTGGLPGAAWGFVFQNLIYSIVLWVGWRHTRMTVST